MERPKKKPETKFSSDPKVCFKGEGWNECYEAMEAFLPDEEEIGEIIHNTYQATYNIENDLPNLDAIAKAIAERLSKGTK